MAEKGEAKQISVGKIILVLLIVLVIGGIIYFIARGKTVNKETANNPEIDMTNLVNAKIENGEKVNTSENLKEAKKFEEIEISNIKLGTSEGYSQLTATAKNPTETYVDEKEISIVFVDSEGYEIAKLGYLLSGINPGEEVPIDVRTQVDLINAYDFRIELMGAPAVEEPAEQETPAENVEETPSEVTE